MTRGTSFEGAVTPDRVQRFRVGEGVELHALRWSGGDEHPVVLVHGLASNAHLWDGVSVALARDGHPVLAVDLRGHGRSDKPASGYDMARVTDDLREVLDASGFERPVVVGQSWGGNVVVELAARFPGTTSGIACIDGGTLNLRRQFGDWDAVRAQLAPPRTAGMPAGDIERFFREAHPDWPETGIQGALACFERRADGTVAPWLDFDRHLLALRGLYDHDPTQAYPRIREPVLLVPADSGKPEWTDVARRSVTEAGSVLATVRVRWMVGDHDLHARHPTDVAQLLHRACHDFFDTRSDAARR